MLHSCSWRMRARTEGDPMRIFSFSLYPCLLASPSSAPSALLLLKHCIELLQLWNCTSSSCSAPAKAHTLFYVLYSSFGRTVNRHIDPCVELELEHRVHCLLSCTQRILSSSHSWQGQWPLCGGHWQPASQPADDSTIHGHHGDSSAASSRAGFVFIFHFLSLPFFTGQSSAVIIS